MRFLFHHDVRAHTRQNHNNNGPYAIARQAQAFILTMLSSTNYIYISEALQGKRVGFTALSFCLYGVMAVRLRRKEGTNMGLSGYDYGVKTTQLHRKGDAITM